MKRALALLALCTFVPMLQGVIASFAPARFCPDLGLLLAVAIGLCWRSVAGGLVLAALLGYATDLLSGSLLGQHALLRMLAFGVARVSSRRLNFRGALPQTVFAGLLTPANAGALVFLTAFFSSGASIEPVALRDLVPQALVNALFAPFVARATERFANLLGEEERGRRPLRLEPRRWTA